MAIYADGTFVTTEVDRSTGPDGDTIDIALYRGEFDTGQFDQIIRWAETAGLVGGGSGVVGARSGEDGGGSLFASTLGDERQVIEAPHLWNMPEIEENRPEAVRNQRAALYELQEGVFAIVDSMVLEQVPDSGFVVLILMRTSDPPEFDASALDYSLFTKIAFGTRCAVVPPSNELAQYLASQPGPIPATTVRGVRHVMARPAYPHESTCADVEEYRPES